MKGKAYANKKAEKDRPEGDFYSTPKSLVWGIQQLIKKEFKGVILEPACGKKAISQELIKMGYDVQENDLYFENKIDYLHDNNYRYIKNVITNPPFSLWDEFVEKAKTHADKILFIGRLNYLGTNGRLQKGIWKNLKSIHVFNRYVDYQTPYRDDGGFHVGAMATGWFLWDMNYTGNPEMFFVDVQDYAKLGNFK